MHGRFIHNVTGNQDAHLCMSQRHTLFIIIVSDTQAIICGLKNKDTIAHNHSYPLLFKNKIKLTCCDAHFISMTLWRLDVWVDLTHNNFKRCYKIKVAVD